MDRKLWALIFLPFCFASSQAQRIQIPHLQTPHEIPSSPTSKPLPRRFVGANPNALYRSLLSSTPTERSEALLKLGHGGAELSHPIDGRLYAVNLNSDPTPEYVLTVNLAPSATFAFVFEEGTGGWWVVGEFSYWWHWTANEAERFIQFREIVAAGRKEILVRDSGGGTGTSVTDLSIYRMDKGSLYPVFHTTEDSYHFIYGDGRSEYEHSDLEYPEPNGEDGHTFLIVGHTKRIEGGQNKRKPEIQTCSAFRWDAVFFIFAEDKANAATACKAAPNR